MKRKRPRISDISFVRESGSIREYRVESNGLRILLADDSAQPVAGCMVTYHVGSRNEATGYTGATHLLEHLMFKGSKHFNKKNKRTVWDLLETKGALVNATTWFDRTNYYEVVPKEYLADAIALEADRMRKAFISEEHRQSEMTVVRNEFERGENDPVQAVDKLVWALAFQAHPYHHSTIGWRSDIEKVPIERLKRFYDDFYWPDNATITIAGSFDEMRILQLIKKHFGKHPKNPHPYPAMYTEEPPQEGERRGIVKRVGVNLICLSHKIPNAHHADLPALTILSLILADGKASRLYRSLVDSAKATSVDAYAWELRDPSLFQSFVTLANGQKHASIEAVVKKVYEDIKQKGITIKELAAAKRSARVSYATRRDGIYHLLASLNEEISTGNWARFITHPQVLQKVTMKDVQRVARTYLIENQSTVGWFINATTT
ncbi:MAG: pitrilysin family protein [Nanoarchaeota archaeon]